jgi:tetratricopeptide (TPR) repeat protein
MPAARITFVIPGQPPARRGGGAPPPPAGLPGRVKAAVRVGARRAGGEVTRVSAVPGEDVVVLHMAGGPMLVLHPATARDLLLGQGRAKRGAGLPDEVPVPAQLRWQGLEQAAPARTRGFLGDVLLQAVEVLTGFAKDDAARFVASQVVARVDGQVDAGVYALSPQALPRLKDHGKRLDRIDPAQAAAGPLLVLLHGTFVDTASTFAKWWGLHPGTMRALFDHYGGRVFALDHPTLGTSPIGNALTLVQALPDGARLHLASHSRGGLVAELLARVCGQGGALAADELAHFADPAHAEHRRELTALARLVKARGITVERVVRVACPARGTLLASGRLDAYLSVLKWTLELAGVPVAPPVLGFLTEVARQRRDPKELPGLAAMLPDSPLVRWLNGMSSVGEGAIAGDLRVVAGDLEGDSLGSWVKTLLADAFYWTDNDIVVQTRSMYGGTPRRGGASYLLDQGGKSTHFNYFAHARTAGAVADALMLDRPSGFRPIGPLSWAGADSSGVRAARAPGADAPPPHERPAVFLLPGILGSHLKADGKRIWLSWRLVGGLARLAWQPPDDGTVQPDGPIGLFYDDLADHLSQTHEVIPFAFDWRRPIEDEAGRLATAVARALDARDANRLPVRLLAHSMGGVLARTMQIVAPAVWDRLMARDGARLLMLGTPNGGSWAPMQVLSGDDTFGNTLAAVGAPFQDHEARRLMAAMPGFLQLQADLLDPDQALDRAGTWKDLAERDLKVVREANWWHTSFAAGEGSVSALEPYEWGVPPQHVLDRAVALRRRLDEQRDKALPSFADKLLLVTGRARFTPAGWRWSDDGLVYLNAVDGGDGRVPLASALLPGVRTWALDCDHGKLPDEAKAFDAYVELLERGDTAKLPRLGSARRGAASDGAAAAPPAALVESRPSRGIGPAGPAEHMRAVLGAPMAEPPAARPAPGQTLAISVVNGDLTFVRQPLLIGHYRGNALTGSERVVNRLVGGAMEASLATGLYPDAVGSHQIFINTTSSPDNPWRAPRPSAAIVIGLGDEGTLKSPALSAAVRQAALAWCQRLAERADTPATIGIAAALLGSGGLGMTPGDAACAIARGVREAVVLVRQGNAARRDAARSAREQRESARGRGTAGPVAEDETWLEWPVITQLTLIELYLERASEAWRALQVQATATPGHFEMAPVIASGVGPLRRQVDTAYRSVGYDLITAECSDPAGGSITFRLDTRRARTEGRAVATQAKLVRDLVRRASNDANDDPQVGHTLFQLLVPYEMEAYLGGTDRMVLELDEHTSPIPWELLDPPSDGRAGADPRPWAIRTRLLRKLRKTRYRTRVLDATADDEVLVVGEPALRDPRYAPLPGALAEAQAVAATLRGPQGVDPSHVRLVEQGEASTILNALFGARWRVVHIAGHGEPGMAGGLVMSDGTFLGPREIGQMRTVPELVFVNCCHLAARDAPGGAPAMDRAAFAASVADALIEIGVRCVIAAGWAVEDAPAKVFATTLYDALLAGQPFIRAVARAREEAWSRGDGGNTWAAYQCYGDPDWVFRRHTGEAQAWVGDQLRETYEGIASALGLALALEKLAVQSKYQGRPPATQLEHIRHLEARFGPEWGGMGAIAEAFGVAYAEAGELGRASEWYGRAVRSNDGSASMRATEQWLNLRVRHALDAASAADTPAAWAQARTLIDEPLRHLDALATLQPTIERLSLSGSAWKRLAMLEARAGEPAAAERARVEAASRYAEAEALAIDAVAPDLFYPALNRMATALAAHRPGADWAGFDPAVVDRVRLSLQERAARDPDFWSMAGLIEVDAFEAVAARRMAAELSALRDRARDLNVSVVAPRYWKSVADNADFALAGWSAGSGREAAAVAQWRALLRGFANG